MAASPTKKPTPGWVDVAGGLAAALGVGIPTVTVVIALADHRDWVSAAVIVGCVLGGAALLLRHALRRSPTLLPKTTVFRAFGPLSPRQIWSRATQLKTLSESVGDGGLVVVVGPSGAGKSTLLRSLASETSSTGTTIYCEDRLDWPSPSDAPRRVVILDQFEHALIGVDFKQPTAEERLNEIRNQVAGLLAEAQAVVLGIRDDWYVKLAFMRDLLPALRDSTVLSYVGSELDPEVRDAFAMRLRELAPNMSIPDLPIGATPMSLQATGQLVELAELDATLGVSRDVPPVVADAITELTRLIALHGPDRNVCLKALHALKCARERALTLSVDDIASVTGDPRSQVDFTVDYLAAEVGIVRKSGARLHLVHDALLESVEAVTSAYLEPSERDNIRGGAQDVRTASRPRDRSAMYPSVIWLIIAVLVVTRAILPADDVWYAASALPPPKRTGILDPIYLLAALPFLVWCLYIVRHHVQIYRACDRTGSETTVSYLTTTTLIIVIVWTVFMVEWWIAAIAVGGLMQAVKWLCYSFEASRPPSVRRMWRLGANRTFNNCGVLFVLGVAFAIAVPAADWSQATLRTTYVVISIILTNAAIYLSYQHLSPRAVARSRGLLLRRQASPHGLK